MAISDTIYQSYSNGGLLVRTNDGQLPITLDDLKTAIDNLALDELDIPIGSDQTVNLGGLLPNNGPTYSATLLANNKYPVLWYHFPYDPFNSNNPPLGERTNLVVIFDTKNTFVTGLCLWDADSNNRNTGQLPNMAIVDKTTAVSDFSNRKAYNGLGNYKYEGPQSLNSHAWYNPLLRPPTLDAVAKTEQDVINFIKEAGNVKEYWVDHLNSVAGGLNDKWAKYISNTYGSGVETEVLTLPENDPSSFFGGLKYSVNNIVAMAFVSDAQTHPTHSPDDYKNKVRAFFGYDPNGQLDPQNVPGWIDTPDLAAVDKLDIVSIIKVALPNVEIDSTSSSIVGEEWLAYFDPSYGNDYSDPLAPTDIKTIREV